MATRIILASGSQARRTLLKNAGVVFSTEAAVLDERAAENEMPPGARSPGGIASHLAIAKAKAVSDHHPKALVIGCDQTMSLGDKMFHKAATLDEARETLMAMRGKTHQLNSAVCLVRDGDVLWSGESLALMRMRPFSDAFLNSYIERNGQALLSSVGCYQLEGEGIQLFDSIEGDYFTILGLPLLPLLAELRKLGINHA